MDFLLFLSACTGLGFTAHVFWHRKGVPRVRFLLLAAAPFTLAGLALTSIAADQLGRERHGLTDAGWMYPLGTALLILTTLAYVVIIALHLKIRD